MVQAILNCIKYDIFERNGQCEKIVLPEVSVRFLSELYRLSNAHDMAHLVGDALSKCGVLTNLPDTIDKSERAKIEKIKTKFDEQVFTAVYRYEKINYELEQIKQVLNEVKISFIPLKGSVIRKFYPEPWMRTSCDIDILVKEDDAEKAAQILHEKASYRIGGKGDHDISLVSASGVNIELHFKLTVLGFNRFLTLNDIWNGSEIESVSECEYKMTDELFLLYHVYHMAKHFLYGGCGIKPFVDLWIIKNKIGYNEEKTERILQESGLLDFYNYALKLTNVWFKNCEHDDVTKRMEKYVLLGGVYGSLEQYVAMKQNKKGGKFRYLLSRIFLSYEQMGIYYPSLKKCPILFPFYQIIRWFRIVFCGGSKKAINEIKINQNLSKETKRETSRLIKELGL